MGLFDKLFGGDGKRSEPTPPASSTPSSAPTPAPGEGSAPVARRERSKPGATPVGSAGGAGAEASDTDAENAALLAAVSGVIANDSPQTRSALYAAILEAQLYLVSMTPEGAEPLPAGEVTLQEGQSLSLATIRDPEGRIFLPAFTDIDRLSLSLPEREKARYLKIAAQSVCRMFLQGEGEGIVINPGQPPSGVITRGEAQVLASGAIPQLNEQGQMVGQAQHQMRITLGKPETAPPQSMIDAITAEAPNHPLVREIHVFKAGVEDQPARTMIGLFMDDGLSPEQMQPSFEAIGKAAFAARGEMEAFDMMPMNEQLLEAVRPLESVVYLRDQQA